MARHADARHLQAALCKHISNAKLRDTNNMNNVQRQVVGCCCNTILQSAAMQCHNKGHVRA
jgi:hypothetical protein